MNDGRGVLREVAWRELFPWLLLFRTFRLSLYPGILLVALLAAMFTSIGWRVASWVFLPTEVAVQPESPQREAADRLLLVDAAELRRFPGAGRAHDPDILARLRTPSAAIGTASPIGYVFERFSLPILRMYRTETSWAGFAFYFFGTLWTLAVWAFGGGMITRMAAVEMGREEQASIRGAARVAVRRWFDYFTAPLYPILGTFAIALLSMPVGWILWSSDAGAVVAGILWIFPLIGGVLSALLLLWLFIGWPLMWPAISSEETGDSFEAMSRSFAYAFQRPLHYLFYAAVAALFGLICWSVVDFLCQLTLNATHWAVSWGSGHERLEEVLRYHGPAAVTAPPGETPAAAGSTTLGVAASMIRGIERILLALSEAFAYSFFWVSATAIYLLLRQNVDRTEFDEVWLDDAVARYPLPSQKSAAPTTAATALAPAAEAATGDPPDVVSEKPSPIENEQAE